MAENRREKDRRYYFTKGQLALLGGAFTLTAIAVFVLGLFVGKELEARRVVRPEEPLVKVPIKPAKGTGDGENARSKDDLTFYNTLTKTPAAKPAEVKTEEKVKELAVKPAVAAKPEAKADTTESADAKSGSKAWSVQVNSYPDAKSANDLIDRLKNKGYNAFVTEATVKGKTWYRVRVGRFASRDEALKVEAALKTDENYSKAFATAK